MPVAVTALAMSMAVIAMAMCIVLTDFGRRQVVGAKPRDRAEYEQHERDDRYGQGR